MSGAAAAPESAMEIEAKAAAWLREKHFESWNDERQTAFDAWLSQSVAHRVACVRLEAAWRKTERVNALHRPVQYKALKNTRTRWAVGGMAAALLLAAPLIGAALTDFSKPKERIFSTSIGGHETVSFADGSQIDLNTNTVIRTRIGPRSRVAILEKGEAFFRIKHDADHPFVAMVAGHKITDIGTKFLIRKEPNRLEVALIEGRARFDAQDKNIRAMSVELRPGDVVIARDNEISLTRKPPPMVARELGWRHGVVIFDNTSLSDAAAEFNRYSETRLIVTGKSASALKINGTFRVDNLDAFAETAQDALGLRLERHPNQIVMSQ